MKNRLPLSLSFDLEPDLLAAVMRLQPILNFTVADDGIRVTAVQGQTDGVTRKDGEATLHYTRKSRLFRALSLLVEHADETELSIVEDSHFTGLSTMIDTSRNGVATLPALYRLIDHLVLMGYDTVLMYIEDTVKLENYQYFGYMRGRYTPEQLRELDDYAFAYGMEIMPCIECYGHMEKYLIWPEAAPVKDTDRVLLAREEKTFALVEEIIRVTSSCLRSRRIHIGMDEAWQMGRGAFLDKNGYVPPFEIFTEYMERLMQIVNKYGLCAMMWSDMYFRAKNDRESYYEPDVEFTAEDIAGVPEGVELVFWHYGEAPGCDDAMLKKHTEFGHNVIYAGGLWSWIGHFPENNYAIEASRASLAACRNNGVHEAMATVWLNDNAECDLFSNLLGLSVFAELCFDPNPSDEKLRSRFEVTADGDYDAFFEMSDYHNTFRGGEEYPNFHARFLGKHLFWQDVMEGLYDTHLFQKPMSEHYAACAERMKTHRGGRWDFLYRFAEQIFAYLAVKTQIAERLVPAYKSGDRKTLEEIASHLLPDLKEKVEGLRLSHRDIWMQQRTMIGWCNLEIRYAGVAARCETAILLLERYLSGEDDRIDSLEEVRLEKKIGGFNKYCQISSPNLCT